MLLIHRDAVVSVDRLADAVAASRVVAEHGSITAIDHASETDPTE
jgi:hypothetical protein